MGTLGAARRRAPHLARLPCLAFSLLDLLDYQLVALIDLISTAYDGTELRELVHLATLVLSQVGEAFEGCFKHKEKKALGSSSSSKQQQQEEEDNDDLAILQKTKANASVVIGADGAPLAHRILAQNQQQHQKKLPIIKEEEEEDNEAFIQKKQQSNTKSVLRKSN